MTPTKDATKESKELNPHLDFGTDIISIVVENKSDVPKDAILFNGNAVGYPENFVDGKYIKDGIEISSGSALSYEEIVFESMVEPFTALQSESIMPFDLSTPDFIPFYVKLIDASGDVYGGMVSEPQRPFRIDGTAIVKFSNMPAMTTIVLTIERSWCVFDKKAEFRERHFKITKSKTA
jgi:hypothetical protein